MTDEEIIKKARRQLPYTSEIQASNYIIPVINETVIDFNSTAKYMPLSKPLYYQVQFRKQIIEGVVIGWEFVSIM